MIFNWYVNENIGTQVIANRLNEMGIVSPRAKVWLNEGIRHILENPVYIGKVRFNTRTAVYVVEEGEIRKTRPLNDDNILVDGKHQAIISEELFQAAQDKRGRAHRSSSNKELRNPLASLLFCECGRGMSYRHSTRGERKYRPPVLVCNAQHLCGNGSVRVSEMMEFIADLLKDKIAEFEREAQTIDDSSIKLHEKMIKSLETKLAEIDAREISLWESQVDPDPAKRMPSHIFQALTAKLVTDRESAEKALAKAREAVATPIDYEKKIVTFQKALDGLFDDEVSVAEKNLLLKACIERIDYHRDAPIRLSGKGVGRQWVMQEVHLDVKLKLTV